jgi:hypothetical protein
LADHSHSLSGSLSDHVQSPKVACRVELAPIMPMQRHIENAGVFPESSLRTVAVVNVPDHQQQSQTEQEHTNQESEPSWRDLAFALLWLQRRRC